MLLLDYYLREEIYSKLNSIRQRSDFQLRLNNGCMNALEKEALNHSARIEYPISNPRSKKGRKSEYRRALRNLENSWREAKSYSGEINEEFIQSTCAVLAPNITSGKKTPYRDVRVYITGSQHIPPAPEKVGREIRRMLESNNKLNSGLEKAFHLHYHGVRIHPFVDGNGRTFRLIQNIILRREGLPPTIIYEGERNYYFDLLNKADIGYKHNKTGDRIKLSKGELEFYNFLASKVNIALDRMIEGCRNSKKR